MDTSEEEYTQEKQTEESIKKEHEEEERNFQIYLARKKAIRAIATRPTGPVSINEAVADKSNFKSEFGQLYMNFKGLSMTIISNEVAKLVAAAGVMKAKGLKYSPYTPSAKLVMYEPYFPPKEEAMPSPEIVRALLKSLAPKVRYVSNDFMPFKWSADQMELRKRTSTVRLDTPAGDGLMVTRSYPLETLNEAFGPDDQKTMNRPPMMRLPGGSDAKPNNAFVPPSTMIKYNPSFKNDTGPDLFIEDVARYLTMNTGNRIYPAIGDIIETYYLGNGSLESMFKRLNLKQQSNAVATRQRSFAETYVGIKWDKRVNVEWKKTPMRQRAMMAFMQNSNRLIGRVKGFNNTVVSLDADTSVERDEFCWNSTNATTVSARIESLNPKDSSESGSGKFSGKEPTKPIRNYTPFNLSSRAGPIYGLDHKRRHLFAAIKTSVDMVGMTPPIDLTKRENSGLISAYLSPKKEPQHRNTIEDPNKGCREIAACNMCTMIPLSLFYHAVEDVMPNVLDEPKLYPVGREKGITSLFGGKLLGGGWDRFLRYMEEFMPRHMKAVAKSNFNVIVGYSDNTYVFQGYMVSGKFKCDFISIDGVKMEASHTAKSTEAINTLRLSEGFGADVEYDKLGDITKVHFTKKLFKMTKPEKVDDFGGFGRSEKGASWADEAEREDKELPSGAEVYEGGLNPQLMDYIIRNGVTAQVDIPLVIGGIAVQGLGIGSGVAGTGHCNNTLVSGANSLVREIGCYEPEIVKFNPAKLTLLDKRKWEGHNLEVYDKESCELAGFAASAYYAFGIHMKIEVGIEDFFTKLKTGDVIMTDMLGNSTVEIEVNGSPRRFAVLQLDRLLRAITFDKVTENEKKTRGDPAKHMDRIIKLRMLYLMGGFAYPMVHEFIISAVGTMIGRLENMVNSTDHYNITSTRDAIERTMYGLGEMLGPDLKEFFDIGPTTIRSYLSGIGVPVMSEVVRVHLGKKEAEKMIESALESDDPHVIITTVAAPAIIRALEERTISGNSLYDSIIKFEIKSREIKQAAEQVTPAVSVSDIKKEGTREVQRGASASAEVLDLVREATNLGKIGSKANAAVNRTHKDHRVDQNIRNIPKALKDDKVGKRLLREEVTGIVLTSVEKRTARHEALDHLIQEGAKIDAVPDGTILKVLNDLVSTLSSTPADDGKIFKAFLLKNLGPVGVLFANGVQVCARGNKIVVG